MHQKFESINNVNMGCGMEKNSVNEITLILILNYEHNFMLNIQNLIKSVTHSSFTFLFFI